jgi:hypothetical protein
VAKKAIPKPVPFDQEQAKLRTSTKQRQRVALISEATGGFLVAEPPPHKFELFLRGDDEHLSQKGIFAMPSGRKGPIVALGTMALLNLCTLKESAPDEPLAVCTATPTQLKKRFTARRGTGEHHRKLLLKPTKSSEWVVEVQKGVSPKSWWKFW